MTTALTQLAHADDAATLEFSYTSTGECRAIATIDEENDEIAVYEGHDLTPAARFEAEALLREGVVKTQTSPQGHPAAVSWRP